MDENGCQQGQTKPFVRRHARQRGKRCKRISQKRREINNEHPLHQVTSPLKAFARSEQAARRARPAPRSRGSSWHRTRGDSASPACPTHDTRRWRSPPRDRARRVGLDRPGKPHRGTRSRNSPEHDDSRKEERRQGDDRSPQHLVRHPSMSHGGAPDGSGAPPKNGSYLVRTLSRLQREELEAQQQHERAQPENA